MTWFWLLFLVLFPLSFHGVHLYPELPAAALLMAGFIFAFPDSGGAAQVLKSAKDPPCPLPPPHVVGPKASNYFFSGLFLSLIPWFHIKYSPVLVFFALIIVFKLFKKKPVKDKASPAFGDQGALFKNTAPWTPAKTFVKPFFCFLIFPVISFVLLLLYTKSLYGSFNPANIFPSEGYFSVPILARVRTLFSYFFDQRDGLLFYSPLFFLAFFGLRRKFSGRGILLGMAAVYILLHANTTLRGAYSPAGRPLMFVSWIFVILIVNYYFSILETAKNAGAGNRKPAYLFKFLSGLSLFVLVWLFFYPLFVYQPVFAYTTERASGLLTFFGSSYLNLPEFFPSFLSISNWGYAANYVWLGLFGLLLGRHYFFSMKAQNPEGPPRPAGSSKVFRGVQGGTHWRGGGTPRISKKPPWPPGAKIISFLLFLILVFLLCFYPHVHLISKNKFTGKKISFYNNSRNFYYIENRDVFRIKAGNRYDIYFDLKRKGADSVFFHFLNPDAAAVKVRNGSRLLFDSRARAEGRFSFKLAALRKLKIKDKLVVHVGFETGAPVDRERPFLFLKIE